MLMDVFFPHFRDKNFVDLDPLFNMHFDQVHTQTQFSYLIRISNNIYTISKGRICLKATFNTPPVGALKGFLSLHYGQGCAKWKILFSFGRTKEKGISPIEKIVLISRPGSTCHESRQKCKYRRITVFVRTPDVEPRTTISGPLASPVSPSSTLMESG